ncbi:MULTISPECIES: threonine ammonia-lyase [Ramlibacter]|uniref:L-threonine dehydratase catabolic TdcB n=1 Tax=Ramlibacter pinisoli TaxID=2682844 RepID=A0A6N8IMA4_9BURK|nr:MULTISPECIES: threonine ammonia-lyase [Ramlibacter]MBA2960639.1 threonine ammonia-lyase [Ramlibacter sp. CGMCC 1.13660]MVQ27969.1 threonine ammonia-lyase [Ramlibacter pinisoli]
MLQLADIRAAAQRLQGQVLRTPCVESKTLSQLTTARVFLKFENLQFTATFKERGACNKLVQLSDEERRRGVIAMSAGNHAQGVAYHAQRLGLRAVIVMPRFTPGVKVEGTRSFGAQVVLHGDTLDEARAHAFELAEREQLTFVHPYDDEAIVAGQGTAALEMLEDVPELDTLVVSVGGGGLIAGMAVAAKAVKPAIEVIGVQTLRFPSMYNLLKHASLPQGQSTIAEGIAVGTPGRVPAALIERHVDDIVLVDEGDVEAAIVLLLEIEKTLVEGAGAAGLAALMKDKARFAGRTVGLLLGGGNIDPLLLAAIIERGMVRNGRLARVRVCARDVPGSLARITATVAEAGANVNEVHHQRAFTMLAAQNVEIELVIQTRGPEHIEAVLQALRGAGFQAESQ